MGLLNDVKAVKETAEAKGVVEVSDKKAKAKARKEAKKEALKAVIAYVEGLKDAPANIKEAVKKLTVVERAGGTAFGPSKLSVIFGSDSPAKGTKVTATEVFTKAGLGYPEMKKYMKKWAERENNPVIVKLDPATATYTVC